MSLTVQPSPITTYVLDGTDGHVDHAPATACGSACLRPLFSLVTDETGIDLAEKRDGSGFVLSWTDYVANEWTEEYPDLSLALLRLAVLQRCAESGFDRMFGQDHQQFPAAAYRAFAALTD